MIERKIALIWISATLQNCVQFVTREIKIKKMISLLLSKFKALLDVTKCHDWKPYQLDFVKLARVVDSKG